MKKLLIIVTAFILISCNNKYTVVLSGNKYNYFNGRDEFKEQFRKEINEKTDSIAYLESYLYFCIMQRIQQKQIEEFPDLEIGYVTDFRILNSENKDITDNIYFDKIDSLKTSIENIVFEERKNAIN